MSGTSEKTEWRIWTQFVKKKLERTITYKLGDTVEEKDDKAPTTIVRRTAGGPF